ncbi:MAG: glycerophosphodiester phosphodiesterase, partial [Tissierellales bacterium]|nr:glycerophosphodiester phosphodiesterase [Tissierellales bacterium]
MTMIFGHRGLSSMYPENTMAAFKGAYDEGMDGIELDVHMTKDGEIVVIHDFFMDRTTDGIGYIKDLKFKDIKKHSAGKWFNEKFSLEKVSSLQEIFEYFKDNNFKINVEIKAGYR